MNRITERKRRGELKWVMTKSRLYPARSILSGGQHLHENEILRHFRKPLELVLISFDKSTCKSCKPNRAKLTEKCSSGHWHLFGGGGGESIIERRDIFYQHKYFDRLLASIIGGYPLSVHYLRTAQVLYGKFPQTQRIIILIWFPYQFYPQGANNDIMYSCLNWTKCVSFIVSIRKNIK